MQKVDKVYCIKKYDIAPNLYALYCNGYVITTNIYKSNLYILMSQCLRDYYKIPISFMGYLYQIPDYPEYVVSDYGHVWSIKTNKQLYERIRPNSCNVQLSKNSYKYELSIAKLVATLFNFGDEKIGQQIRYKDKNSANNKRTNLYWVGYDKSESDSDTIQSKR